MFARHTVGAAILGTAILSACAPGSSGSSFNSAAVPPTFSATQQAAIGPDKDCGGTNGVKVLPCPISLTRRTRSGIVVTVSGPGVVNSYLGKLNSCFNGKLCYNAEREGSSQIQWRITSGRACGGADIEFFGVDANGNKVGYAFLKSANLYCP
jgi:hypothetical protein